MHNPGAIKHSEALPRHSRTREPFFTSAGGVGGGGGGADPYVAVASVKRGFDPQCCRTVRYYGGKRMSCGVLKRGNTPRPHGQTTVVFDTSCGWSEHQGRTLSFVVSNEGIRQRVASVTNE
ncbi:hypothetical protein QAD02_003796 [Eretmocerus hayati]|uniref:Uncharacterized protein n=1 Tax=Eretmocerus hayati TaxID=131215 RepID=A0ACC2NQK6_9HYME|nr:hypothetical protein QAD02_003796 [Eretmocerus hayati]